MEFFFSLLYVNARAYVRTWTLRSWILLLFIFLVLINSESG